MLERFEKRLSRFLKQRASERQLPPVSILCQLADQIVDEELIQNISPAFSIGKIASDATENWLVAVLSLKGNQRSQVSRVLNSIARSKSYGDKFLTVGDLRKMPLEKVAAMLNMGERRARFIKDLFPGGQDSRGLHFS